MYKRAFKTFCANWPIFFLISLTVAILEQFLPDLKSGGTLVIYGFAAMISHRIILLGESYKLAQNTAPSQQLPYWGFIWRYIVFFVICVAIIMIALVAIVLFVPNAKSALDGNLTVQTTVTLCSIGLLCLASWGMSLALWGTCLPAAAIKADASFSAARQRSRGQVWRIFARLALGPFAYTLASTVCIGVALYWVEILEIPVIATVIISSLIGLLGLFTTHLVATILSMAYDDGEAV